MTKSDKITSHYNKIMLPKYLKGKILVMIDAANLESSVKDLGWWIDYIKLRNLFDGKKLVEIRNYCVHHGEKSQNNFFTFLKKNKFILITKPLKIIKQKARLFQRAIDNRFSSAIILQHIEKLCQPRVYQALTECGTPANSA